MSEGIPRDPSRRWPWPIQLRWVDDESEEPIRVTVSRTGLRDVCLNRAVPLFADVLDSADGLVTVGLVAVAAGLMIKRHRYPGPQSDWRESVESLGACLRHLLHRGGAGG
jgi:hypothetical protein